MGNDEIIALAKTHLDRIPVGEAFGWAGLFQDDWESATQTRRPQDVGEMLRKHFSTGDDPVIVFVRINRSPRYSVWRKDRPLNQND